MTASIYDQHNAAFSNVEAFVVMSVNDNGEPVRVATVAFKRAASNLRTTCYFHIIDAKMAKGTANGGGYDKSSAAAHHAVKQISADGAHSDRYQATVRDMQAAIRDEGRSWKDDLEAAGFKVWRAV